MNIIKATHRFEEWLGRHTPLVKADLRLKHDRMADAVFPFLRATFYRWMQIWPEVCPDLAKAPRVLAVGDLHVENFGTWRDIEGRLVWGVNDFDEAAVLPYTIDLVRLATSAIFAIEDGHLALKPKDACAVDLGRLQRISRPRRPSLRARRRKHLAARRSRPEYCAIQFIFGKRWTACQGYVVKSPLVRGRLLSISCQSAASPTGRFDAWPAWEVSGTFVWSQSRCATAPGSLAKPRRSRPRRFTGPLEMIGLRRSSTRPSSAVPFVAPILSCSCADTGLSGACRPTVRASN